MIPSYISREDFYQDFSERLSHGPAARESQGSIESEGMVSSNESGMKLLCGDV